MAITKLVDVINFVPEVLEADILFAIREANTVYNSKIVKRVVNNNINSGRTLTIALGGNLGKLQLKPEGEDMAKDKISTDKITLTPKVMALEVPFTMESADGYNGNLEQDIKENVIQSYIDTLDGDVFDRIATTTTTAIDDSTNTINIEKISEALAAVKSRNNSAYTLLVAHEQVHQLRVLKDENGNAVWSEALNNNVQITGQIGSVYGVPVIIVDQMAADAGVFTNFLVEDGAIGYLDALGGSFHLDSEWNKRNLTKSIFIHAVYQTFLYPYKKVQPIKFKA